MSDYYPELPEGIVFPLEILLQKIKEDPDYLEFAPYDAEEKAILDIILAPHMRRDLLEDDDLEFEENKWELLEQESKSLFKMLKEHGGSLGKGDSTADRMAYFRTATQLLEKIVAIQERCANLRQINHFHTTVLTVMEDTLTTDQRTQVLQRLKGAITDDA